MNWHDYFVYDENSPSCLRWKVDLFAGSHYKIPLVKIDDVAGCQDGNGYWLIGLKGKIYRACRVVWEMHNSVLTVEEDIDHFNRVKSDNVISNLRKVSNTLNRRNMKMFKTNTSGITGVNYEKRDNVWRAFWKEDGRVLTKSFACNKYPNAFEKACKYREQQIERLNLLGAGYTAEHGTAVIEKE